MLDGFLEEGADVVPIVLYDPLHPRTVLPVAVHLQGKHTELLIVRILFQSVPPLKAVNDEFEGDLCIPHEDSQVLLIKLLEALSLELYPLSLQLLHIFVDVLLTQSNELEVA